MEAETAETVIPEPIPERNDITKAKRNVFFRHLAHEGLMLEKIMRQNRRAERLEKFAATGEVKHLDAPEEESEPMGVNIGNEFHYHLQDTANQADAVKPEIVKPEIVQPVVAPVANGKAGILPLIAMVLGTIGVAGIGAGALAIWDRVQHKPVPQVTNIENPPQDWELGITVSDQP